MSQAVDRFRLSGATLDKKFRVERIIAEGGFGLLYYGTHLMLDRPIALKVLKTPPDFNENAKASFMEGFAREAKTIVRISHPNIVQVLDFGVSEMPDGEMAPWMALEWLAGPTLRDVLIERRGQGGQSPQDVLALMRPGLEALAYAHEEGVAHRDLKPANMMLVPTKRGNVLKLLDFGIAKVMEEGEEAGSGQTMTTSSLKAFSLAYAAPEQTGGSRTGPWTDVHAMALILTELLTDHSPYDGKERTEICIDALSSRRPTPSKRNKDAGAWEHVLNRALALKPADRFASAGEFLQALDQSLQSPMQRPGDTGQWATAPNGPPLMPGTYPPGSVPQMPYQQQGYGPGGFGQSQYGIPTAFAPAPYGPGQHTGPGGMDPTGNPTTLRGATTSSSLQQSSGGGAAKFIGIGFALVGLMGGLGAFAVIRARARAAVVAQGVAPIIHATSATPPVMFPSTAPVQPAGTAQPAVLTGQPAQTQTAPTQAQPTQTAQPTQAAQTGQTAQTQPAGETQPAENTTASNGGGSDASANHSGHASNSGRAGGNANHGGHHGGHAGHAAAASSSGSSGGGTSATQSLDVD